MGNVAKILAKDFGVKEIYQHGPKQVTPGESVETNGVDPLQVGKELEVKARVNLGAFSPDDIEVQLFHGLVDTFGEIPSPRTVTMSHNGAHEGNTWQFMGKISCRSSGQHGFAVRVLPKHQNLTNSFEPGLISWG